MTSIVAKQNGRFQVRWELPNGAEGVRRRGSKTFETKLDAEIFCSFVHPDAHRRVADVDFEKGMLSWIDYRLAAGLINAKTAERQMNIANNFGRAIGDKKLILLKSDDLTKAQVTFKKIGAAAGRPFAARTSRQHFAVGKKFCAFLAKAGMIAGNPFDAIDVPKALIERVVAPQEDRVETLLELAGASLSCGGLLWLIIVLISQTGLRRGEALALRWGDLDSGAGCLLIHRALMQTRASVTEKKPKTEAGHRKVALADWLVALLQAHRDAQTALRRAAGLAAGADDYVFGDAEGAPLFPNRVSGMVAYLKRRAGWPKRAKGLHGLRHRFATLLCRSALPISDIAKVLGHADASFTLRTYVHADEEVVPTAGLIPTPRITGAPSAAAKPGAGKAGVVTPGSRTRGTGTPGAAKTRAVKAAAGRTGAGKAGAELPPAAALARAQDTIRTPTPRRTLR
ncbi:tyrosine-type recombinase/integrase [Rubrimonas sp.]|uniref:tyrosine-type recombinase/integrase n=1 Tax=Rubrimonas sp. TaxID=2036015 RepID=UPI002FDDE5CE